MENTVFSSGDIVKVILPLASDGYDYIVGDGESYEVGDFVRVPLRRKEEVGVIFGRRTTPLDYDISKVKSIISVRCQYKVSAR